MYICHMLNFDRRGNLTPSGLISSNIPELENYFVNNIQSNTRSNNYQKYRKYSDDLKNLVGGQILRQWINGSFVNSRNRNPRDIDLVTFVDHQTIVQLGTRLNNLRPLAVWEIYEVDAYIIEVHPAGSVYYNRFTHSDILYWENRFSNTKRNRMGQMFSKGFLEIYY
jgi:hypothetical protein